MFPLIQTREAFEGRLRTMAGLEFVVAQEPAEMGPGMGTGVWVIAKQTRRKRPGDVDDITVHRAYFVVGENIYQGPTMADALHSRIVSANAAGGAE
jgi:mediator of RNA polymerase II transcription subunit 6